VTDHAPPPAWLRGRRLYDGLSDAACRVHPRLALAAAGAAGRVSHRLRAASPSSSEIDDLFSAANAIAAPDPHATARAISALRFRNRTILSLVRRQGLAPLARLVDPRSAARLRDQLRPSGPAIIITWHLGALFGAAAVLVHAGIPALAIRLTAVYEPTGSLELAFTGTFPEVRAATMWKAASRLKRGGVVLMAADGPDAERTSEIGCLGRRVTFARGPFSLARLTGAVLVPMVPRWERSGTIAAVVGEHLQPGGPPGDRTQSFEIAAAAAAAAWCESHVLASPQDLWLSTLRLLLHARRVVPC
jgi:hypothetical protein